MPHYRFELTDGQEVIEDQEGLELPGPAAAREEAAKLAADLSEGRLYGERQWAGWRVAILDEHGNTVDQIPVMKAQEV